MTSLCIQRTSPTLDYLESEKNYIDTHCLNGELLLGKISKVSYCSYCLVYINIY